MKPVDLNALLANYYDTGLYLAVNKDRTDVVGPVRAFRTPWK